MLVPDLTTKFSSHRLQVADAVDLIFHAMSDARDSLADLEKHRLRLEDNVNQLQKALQHWQTWDAEYEGLKEEVEAVTAADEATELQRIHGEFDGELLSRTEIDEIFGQPKLKTKEQIINVLERRIDYVSKNIETLQKQLETAENKHAAATVISQPDATDEEGQPILDIVEELDEDDNVVSFRLNKPGDSFGDVEALLKKAGISDDSGSKPEKTEPVSKKAKIEEKPSTTKEQVLDSVTPSKPSSTIPDYTPKKSVSFSEDTKTAEEPEQEPEISWRAKRVKEIMSSAKDQEDISMQAAVIPKDESPEDAALRQQMLRYGMSEVGAVVAEMSTTNLMKMKRTMKTNTDATRVALSPKSIASECFNWNRNLESSHSLQYLRLKPTRRSQATMIMTKALAAFW
jgi:unconventional prefoldin RPB5 interactor 1